MRSRAVWRPLACCRATAASVPGVHRGVDAPVEVAQLARRSVWTSGVSAAAPDASPIGSVAALMVADSPRR
jgi:hypothetical protein